ncbi:pyridoxamine 5'-phosphate oxidase family protein [Halalkalibacter akibai]|uniref:GTPase n=1 Tax=Halalkalibacter akibai (strain ATCC 43226 / DSM 21942 / CIP 109018 / JCM 9157 / 1139) TaxID=1236973 RepID=W4QP02_HALA3|nr:pyridoxamine 5'-phosphate oxidase family protein [Halalkalibacter akibai]GAE33806.1 GTPase [Halalkalibacter akibai JCM 9157]
MANRIESGLTDEILPLLQKEQYVLLSTIDFELGTPNVNAISWIYAPDAQTIRFTIDNRSRIIQNIKANEGVVLTLIANGSTYSIAGTAQIIVEKLEDVPLKLALLELDVKEVRDVMFYGAKMSTQPKYEKTYDAQAAAKLDHQVMQAMKRG